MRATFTYRTLGVGNGERSTEVFRVGNGVFDAINLLWKAFLVVYPKVWESQVIAIALNAAVRQLRRQLNN